jgi:hypothetical protein
MNENQSSINEQLYPQVISYNYNSEMNNINFTEFNYTPTACNQIGASICLDYFLEGKDYMMDDYDSNDGDYNDEVPERRAEFNSDFNKISNNIEPTTSISFSDIEKYKESKRLGTNYSATHNLNERGFPLINNKRPVKLNDGLTDNIDFNVRSLGNDGLSNKIEHYLFKANLPKVNLKGVDLSLSSVNVLLFDVLTTTGNIDYDLLEADINQMSNPTNK